MPSTLSRLRQFVPWCVAAIVFFYLFRKYPPRQMWQALLQIQAPVFFIYAVLYFLGLLIFDSITLHWLFKRFSMPISFQNLFFARMVSYLIAIPNYFAGQAALAFYIKKSKGYSFFKSLSTVLLVILVDFYMTVLMAYTGTFFLSHPITLSIPQIGAFEIQKNLQWTLLIASAAALLHLVFWRQWASRFLKLHIRIHWLDWLRGKHLFCAFHEAKTIDYLKIALLRLPYHLVIIIGYYLLFHTFGIEVSLTTSFTIVPYIMLVGLIPITPGGLGIVQVVTLQFLKNYGPETLILAMSISWTFTNYLLKALFGLIALRKMGRASFALQGPPSVND